MAEAAVASGDTGQGNTPAAGGQGNTPAGGNTPGVTGTPTFYDNFQDAGLKEWAGKKGWTNVESLAKSAHSLEQFVGAPHDEVVRIGKNATPEQVRQVLGRLGLPDTADKYEIAEPPKGTPQNENMVKWSKETFHKLGLLPSQAKELSTAYTKLAADIATQQATDYEIGYQADVKALQSEWRGGYDSQMAKAQNAARSLDFDGTAIDAMESAIGYAATMRFFAKLGDKLGESQFVESGDGKSTGFGTTMTPAEAKAEWLKFSTDPGVKAALMSKSHPGHNEAMRKKSQLMALGAAD